MLRKQKRLTRFYQKLIREEKISYPMALKVYEILHREAVSLGVINSKNILEGLEVDLRMSQAIHGLSHD